MKMKAFLSIEKKNTLGGKKYIYLNSLGFSSYETILRHHIPRL